MGIRHFYVWYKSYFSGCVSATMRPPDVLAIDINGLFYECAQDMNTKNNPVFLFRKICDRIEWIRKRINPQRMLILCVDGVAGMGKMNQQRHRRMQPFRNKSILNYNHFTPGTRLLDHLTKYIDWYIKMMMTYSTEWQRLKILYSNEKVPGEGEHKAVSLIKTHAPLCMSICLYGSDADMIMLGTLLPHKTVTIARDTDLCLEYVEIHHFRKKLLRTMKWCDNHSLFVPEQALTDFVLVCFLLGNDFLPPIPSLDMSDHVMDLILETYRQTGCEHGHLTESMGGAVHGRGEALACFFRSLSLHERSLVEEHTKDYTIRNMVSRGVFDFDRHRASFYRRCHMETERFRHYLDGMFWCINYYQYGMPDWEWCYGLPAAPFLTDIAEWAEGYQSPRFSRHYPMPTLLQLFMLLPYHDRHLLPKCMASGNAHRSLPTYSLLPEWERVYTLYEKKFIPEERRRNRVGRSFQYAFQPHHPSHTVHSCYGNIINCPVQVTLF